MINFVMKRQICKKIQMNLLYLIYIYLYTYNEQTINFSIFLIIQSFQKI